MVRSDTAGETYRFGWIPESTPAEDCFQARLKAYYKKSNRPELSEALACLYHFRHLAFPTVASSYS